MSPINISFLVNSPRLTIREWHELSGPDGTIEKDVLSGKDLIKNERLAYSQISMADLRYQVSISKKKRFVETPSYSYEDYLRLRLLLCKDKPTEITRAMTRLRFSSDPEPEYYDNGNYKSGVLDGGQKYMGIKLAGSRPTMLHRDGWIAFSYLAEDQQVTVGVTKYLCKAGTEIQGHPNHTIKMISLAKEQHIRWTDEKGNKYSIPAAAAPVIFHNNGIPSSFALAKDGLLITVSPNGEIEGL